jgi:ribosome-binding factor A
MKPFKRADRVSGLIQRSLSDILRKDIKDPRLELATITSVKMSSDLKLAKIYFSISGGKERVEGAARGFESALGYIKRTLASELGLRYMPEIKFFYDESFDYGAHIDEVLKSVKAAEDGKDHTPVESE